MGIRRGLSGSLSDTPLPALGLLPLVEGSGSCAPPGRAVHTGRGTPDSVDAFTPRLMTCTQVPRCPVRMGNTSLCLRWWTHQVDSWCKRRDNLVTCCRGHNTGLEAGFLVIISQTLLMKRMAWVPVTPAELCAPPQITNRVSRLGEGACRSGCLQEAPEFMPSGSLGNLGQAGGGPIASHLMSLDSQAEQGEPGPFLDALCLRSC